MRLRERLRRGWLALAAAVALLGVTSTSGCSPRLVTDVARTALWTATIVGYVAVLEYHDAHFHYEHCGHYRRYHDSQWVYYYQGRWEYYDNNSGRWYFYIEQ